MELYKNQNQKINLLNFEGANKVWCSAGDGELTIHIEVENHKCSDYYIWLPDWIKDDFIVDKHPSVIIIYQKIH